MFNTMPITVAIHPRAGEPAAGAGWLLPDGDVLTCQHVVEDAAQVEVRQAGSADGLVAYEVSRRIPPYRDESTGGLYSGDLALLRPAGGAGPLIPARSNLPGDPQPGDTVDGYGFPAKNTGGQSGWGHVGQRSAIGRPEVMDPPEAEHRLFQGFSGCPIVSRSSRDVIGLFVLTYDGARRGHIIPVGHIAKWLEEEGLEKAFLRRQEEQSPSLRRIRKEVFGSAPPEAPFPLRVREASHVASPEPDARYDDGRDLDPLTFVSRVRDTGHAILLSDGGSGKSTFFVAVAEATERSGKRCLWLDVKALGKDLGSGDPADRFGAFAKEGPVAEGLLRTACLSDGWRAKLADGQTLFLIADGLNEVGDAASELVGHLVRYARERGNLTLICNARSTTPLGEIEEFTRYAMVPLPHTVIEAATGRTAEQLGELCRVLAQPQMLSIALRIEEFGLQKRSEMFERYFTRVIQGIPAVAAANPERNAAAAAESVLSALAAASYATLHKRGVALTMDAERFGEELEEKLAECARRGAGLPVPDTNAVVEALCESGIMQRSAADEGAISFHHPLYAEWLAVRHFVGLDRTTWTSAGFDAISLEDSSDDALKLAVELVSQDRRDEFLTLMYDWRWRRVLGFAVEGIEGLTPELRHAFIGLNVLRLCDHFEHTRAAMRPFLEPLRSSGDSFIENLVQAAQGGEAQVVAAIRAWFGDKELPEALRPWTALLDADTDALLVAVVSPHPFVGWAASNLLRVRKLPPGRCLALMMAYEASRVTAPPQAPSANRSRGASDAGVGVRWRLVHSFGRTIPEEDIAAAEEFILRVWLCEDEHRDVRFGACRVLLEFALDFPGRRADILRKVEERLRMLGDFAAGEKPGKQDPEFRAAEQLWRAARPAEGRFDPDFLVRWKKDFTAVIAAALRAAQVRGWPAARIEAAREYLDGEADA